MKGKNPEISVIIPVRNAEKTLAECLKSVLNQTYKNYELIIVNNNSTDSTKEIIFHFQKKNPRIKYVFEEQIGRGAARNSGIDNAKGKIIAMTDSDCIVSEDWLEKISGPIRKNKEEVVQGAESEAMPNFWSRNIQLANEKFLEKSLSNEGYIQHLDTKNFSVKADLIKKLRFDKEIKNIEDFEFGLRIREIAKIKFLENVKVRHFHKSSLRKFFAMQFDRAYWAYFIFQKHKKDKNIEKEIMFTSLSPGSYLIFPFWITKEFVSDYKKGFFLFVSNIAWAFGTAYAILDKTLNNFSLKSK